MPYSEIVVKVFEITGPHFCVDDSYIAHLYLKPSFLLSYVILKLRYTGNMESLQVLLKVLKQINAKLRTATQKPILLDIMQNDSVHTLHNTAHYFDMLVRLPSAHCNNH